MTKHAKSSAITRHKMDQCYKKRIFGRYHLHSLHGKICGLQFLIPDLQALKVFSSFNSVELFHLFFQTFNTISEMLRSKNDRLSVPIYTLLTGETFPISWAFACWLVGERSPLLVIENRKKEWCVLQLFWKLLETF